MNISYQVVSFPFSIKDILSLSCLSFLRQVIVSNKFSESLSGDVFILLSLLKNSFDGNAINCCFFFSFQHCVLTVSSSHCFQRDELFSTCWFQKFIFVFQWFAHDLPLCEFLCLYCSGFIEHLGR